MRIFLEFGYRKNLFKYFCIQVLGLINGEDS